MAIPFVKMHGTGNDFVVINGRELPPTDRVQLARTLCARHTGIGSDGLVIVEPHTTADFSMDFYNPDGSQSFCGNGSRCAFAAAQRWSYVDQKGVFEAIDGQHTGLQTERGIRVSMGDTQALSSASEHVFVHTGSPHAVVWVNDVDDLDLQATALPIRNSELYAPGGTNVNVVAQNANGIRMRTFERGVERETLSCGTGVTAAALASHAHFGLASPVAVDTKGGQLWVTFEATNNGFNHIWLEGPTAEVFQGEWATP